MPAPTNAFKAALRTDDVQVGTWLGFADAYVAEAAATADFDWFLIDGEHAPNDIPSILLAGGRRAGRGAERRGPLARSARAWMVKQALDLGVQTLLMPMVDSAEMAKKLVRDCLYPPQGTPWCRRWLWRGRRTSTPSATTCPRPMTKSACWCRSRVRAAMEGAETRSCKWWASMASSSVPLTLAADMGFSGQFRGAGGPGRHRKRDCPDQSGGQSRWNPDRRCGWGEKMG